MNSRQSMGPGGRSSPGPSFIGWVTMGSHLAPLGLLWPHLQNYYTHIGSKFWALQHVPCDTSQVVAVLSPTLQMKTLRSCLQSTQHGPGPWWALLHISPPPGPPAVHFLQEAIPHACLWLPRNVLFSK